MENKYIYFVEGKCEVALLEALKANPPLIKSGKIRKLNLIQEKIFNSVLMGISSGTKVAFVFDTDVAFTRQLKSNIELVRRHCKFSEIIYLPQVRNFEDELVRCTDVSRVEELTQSAGKKDFKKDFCGNRNCRALLERHHLNMAKLWVTQPPSNFDCDVVLNGEKIKVKK